MATLGLTMTPSSIDPLLGTTAKSHVSHQLVRKLNLNQNQTESRNKKRTTITAALTRYGPNMPSPLETAPCKPSHGKSHDQLMMKVSAESLQYESGFLGAVPGKSVAAVGDGGVINAMTYLTRILSAKVYDVAVESPLDYATKLSERLGVHVWLKREDLQPVFSFKLRGAYNMMAKLPRELLSKGVICSSAGNHAQGVALSAQTLGCKALVVMPVTTPEIKWKTVERLGATVVLEGETYDEAQAYAKQRAEVEGRAFIPPFDQPDVIAGQGTVGMEIVRQITQPLHAIFVPVGGGGLIAGIAAYVKRVRPEVKIIGVEPYDANAMALSLHHGQRIMLHQVGGFADGVAVKVVGEETFRLCRELIDGVVLVSRDAICASIKDMFEEKRSILEPAGALAIAGAEAYCKFYGLKSENVVAITSGANMNFDRLRLVSQLADVGRQCEAVLATFIPKQWGYFNQFCEVIGPLKITEMRYRNDLNKDEDLVIYSVGYHSISELKELLQRMKYYQLKTINLTDDELVKDHFQFMVGGRRNIENEILCRFVLPEKPGALIKFLDAFSPRWNISLFHYRCQGENSANILVGFQVVNSEMKDFKRVADSLGSKYELETNNKVLQMLLQ